MVANDCGCMQSSFRIMNITILTPIRLLGEGLAACINASTSMKAGAILNSVDELRHSLESLETNLIIVDVSQGVEVIDVREIAVRWPAVPIVALGLAECKQEVIKCGRSGYSGYISRDTSIEKLCQALSDIADGKQSCPPEISGGMIRALFRVVPEQEQADREPSLTRREREVLDLIGQGMTNKEICRTLCLSLPTVKHHVHNLLEKLGISRRAEAMKQVPRPPLVGLCKRN